MGLIEDGAVAGALPESECFTVHYPGYPSSTSRAVETLGGLEEIAKKRSVGARRVDSRSENRNEGRLELRFRPEDPYCHPAFGDLRPCNGLLLKVSKKKGKKKGEEDEKQQQQRSSCSDGAVGEQCGSSRENGESSAQSEKLSASIVARVRQAYYFDGLADYQFVVPVHAAKSRQKKRRWTDVEPQLEKGGLMDTEHDELIMLVPKLFSPKDIPDEILLRPSVRSTSKPQPQPQQQTFAEDSWEMDIEACLKLSFEIEKIPEKVNWEDNIPKHSREWEWQMALSKLFDERPIWPRWSLLERLVDDGVGVSYNQLRRLLTRCGYYFSTGPFGQFWIRKGYDPRTDPESRIYQKVEFRLRDLLPSLEGVNLNTEYEIGDFGMPNTKQKFSGNNVHHELKQTWKDICRFQNFPLKSCTLQLFELDDDYIQQQIRDPQQQTTCMRSTGWFSRTTFELLSLWVKIRFLSVFPKKGAEKLLKSFRERFEKLKKLEILNRIHGRNSEDLDVNRDTMSQTSKDAVMKNSDVGPMDEGENGCAVHENEDNLEEEEEEEEEELDEYESHPVAVDDVSFSPNASSYPTGENIDINYLQELLCNKIVEEGGDYQTDADHQDAGASDGEYQIYEQDSDDGDNYYDDEDDDC